MYLSEIEAISAVANGAGPDAVAEGLIRKTAAAASLLLPGGMPIAHVIQRGPRKAARDYKDLGKWAGPRVWAGIKKVAKDEKGQADPVKMARGAKKTVKLAKKAKERIFSEELDEILEAIQRSVGFFRARAWRRKLRRRRVKKASRRMAARKAARKRRARKAQLSRKIRVGQKKAKRRLGTRRGYFRAWVETHGMPSLLEAVGSGAFSLAEVGAWKGPGKKRRRFSEGLISDMPPTKTKNRKGGYRVESPMRHLGYPRKIPQPPEGHHFWQAGGYDEGEPKPMGGEKMREK